MKSRAKNEKQNRKATKNEIGIETTFGVPKIKKMENRCSRERERKREREIPKIKKIENRCVCERERERERHTFFFKRLRALQCEDLLLEEGETERVGEREKERVGEREKKRES